MPVGDACRWPSTSYPQEGSCGLRLGKGLIRTGRVEQLRKRKSVVGVCWEAELGARGESWQLIGEDQILPGLLGPWGKFCAFIQIWLEVTGRLLGTCGWLLGRTDSSRSWMQARDKGTHRPILPSLCVLRSFPSPRSGLQHSGKQLVNMSTIKNEGTEVPQAANYIRPFPESSTVDNQGSYSDPPSSSVYACLYWYQPKQKQQRRTRNGSGHPPFQPLELCAGPARGQYLIFCLGNGTLPTCWLPA